MKKLFITMLLCSVFSMSMMAQSTKTIKGAVIDKNGNPLPGALVEATGGAESTTVDADGTFSMEVPVWLKSATAKYAGMKNKTLKVKSSDMIFKMSPKTGGWFVNVVGSYVAPFDDVLRGGIMGGKLGNWGYYGKIMYPVGEDIEGYELTGTLGVIKQISSSSNNLNLYGYLGAGYGTAYHEIDDYSISYGQSVHYERYFPHSCLAIEAGFIINYKFLNFNVGYGITGGSYQNHDISLGIGYRF